LAGNYFVPRHIQLVVKNDEELSKLRSAFGNSGLFRFFLF